jgi:FtsP/CotA-like multicopper oxidase with cupredoxin domain
MTKARTLSRTLLAPIALLAWPTLAVAQAAGDSIYVQCPGDANGDAIPDPIIGNGNRPNPDYDPNVKCMHLGAGDGFVTMADGKLQYIFAFTDLTGVADLDNPPNGIGDEAMEAGMLAAEAPSPTIMVDEGNEFYLTLTNVGMMNRPDLFDPHTVHWHGFPEASSVFDGVPDASISINMGASLTYYYLANDPGTYMYHCHVEAAEHMQMGMLGNLYVRPAQNQLPDGTVLGGGFVHHTGYTYAYNDGDGSTYHDVDVPIQIGSFDPDFHDASMTVQPLPFAMMRDRYALLNGRGYPDTVNPNALVPPAENGGKLSQAISSRIEVAQGEKILLRISNLNVTRFYTLGILGLPMRVVGKDARLLRGPSPDGGMTPGKALYYDTGSVTLGGGESVDAIVDTSAVTPGTYFLYTKNLNYLSNDKEDFGGMMTEIVVN